jgi:hypothetical protein
MLFRCIFFKNRKGGKNTALRILTISYEKPKTNVERLSLAVILKLVKAIKMFVSVAIYQIICIPELNQTTSAT